MAKYKKVKRKHNLKKLGVFFEKSDIIILLISFDVMAEGSTTMRKIAVIFLVLIQILAAVQFTSCSKIKAESKTAPVNNQIKIDRSTPQTTVTQYYSNEIKMTEKDLLKFFYSPELMDLSEIKLKISIFKVKKINLDKVIDIKNKGDYSVISCVYDTYFDGINEPRKDIEVIGLIRKDDIWYILNDPSNIPSADSQWIDDTETELQNELTNNVDAKTIYKAQNDFDTSNKDFMTSCQQKLVSQIQKNNTK